METNTNSTEIKKLVREGLEMGAKPILPKKATAKTTVKTTVKAKTLAKPSAKPVVKKVGNKDTGLALNGQADGKELNLKQLCNEMSKKLNVDIDPRMARRKLRKAKISGHDFRDRWTFLRDSNAFKAAVAILTPAKEEADAA